LRTRIQPPNGGRIRILQARIGERKRLVKEIKTWERRRNDSGARIKLMFNTERARTYPRTAKESKSL
jgi:hypothetical protein